MPFGPGWWAGGISTVGFFKWYGIMPILGLTILVVLIVILIAFLKQNSNDNQKIKEDLVRIKKDIEELKELVRELKKKWEEIE